MGVANTTATLHEKITALDRECAHSHLSSMKNADGEMHKVDAVLVDKKHGLSNSEAALSLEFPRAYPPGGGYEKIRNYALRKPDSVFSVLFGRSCPSPLLPV